MHEKKWRIGLTGCLLLLLNLGFFIGMQTVLTPCEMRPDGSWMNCHWAGQALTGIAAVLAGLALMHLVIPYAHVRLGLSLAVLLLSVLTFLLPGHLIALCMMETMRCHTVMQPAVTVISLLNILLASADIYVHRRRGDG